MGCCESCFQNKDGEPTERDPLLTDGNRIVVNSQPIVAENHQEEYTPVGSISRSRQDEQSLLNDILKKYSDDIVDVTAMDSRIDAVEYMNRVTLYNRKLAALGGRLDVKKPHLRSVTVPPVQILSAPPVSYENLMKINGISENLAAAMKEVRVVKKQDLTVDLAQR